MSRYSLGDSVDVFISAVARSLVSRGVDRVVSSPVLELNSHMNRPRRHHTEVVLRKSSCDVLNCAAYLKTFRASVIVLVGMASCSLDSSPVGTRSPEARGSSWQPYPADRASAQREGGDVDASRAIDPGSHSRPRTMPDAGTQSTSNQADGGSELSKHRDGAVGDPVQPATGGALNDAAVTMGLSDAATPSRSGRDASTSSDDAAVVVDASTASVSTQPDCKPGEYEGDFDGTLQAGEIPVSMVSGPITATLTLDASGSYLNIEDMRVVGRDVTGNTLRATVTGKINCKTLEIGVDPFWRTDLTA